jgi:hypothetical protein
MATAEGVPFFGMRFFPGVAPRVLGATKRRFEKCARRLVKAKEMGRLTVATWSWYQFAREANVEGFLQARSRKC